MRLAPIINLTMKQKGPCGVQEQKRKCLFSTGRLRLDHCHREPLYLRRKWSTWPTKMSFLRAPLLRKSLPENWLSLVIPAKTSCTYSSTQHKRNQQRVVLMAKKSCLQWIISPRRSQYLLKYDLLSRRTRLGKQRSSINFACRPLTPPKSSLT